MNSELLTANFAKKIRKDREEDRTVLFSLRASRNYFANFAVKCFPRRLQKDLYPEERKEPKQKPQIELSGWSPLVKAMHDDET